MPVPPSEQDWLRAAAAGDRVALSQLLLHHYDELMRYISDRVPRDVQSVIVAEDVLQQAFVRVAQNIHTFECRENGSFIGWMKTIAGNVMKDAQKRRIRERRCDGLAVDWRSPADNSGGNLVDALVGDSNSPSRIAHHRDSVQKLRAALASLPEDHREVIERYYLNDESLDGIADSMQRTRDAVRGICYRARNELREILGRSSWYYSG